MSGRNSVLRGDIIELTAVFLDAAGDPADPTDLVFSIYPPGSNPELGAPVSEAWVYNVTLSSGGSGPEASPTKTLERTAEGYYKYAFTVPEDADLGSAFDRWEATLDLEDLDEVFNFVIVGGGSVGTTKLYNNNIVFIKLSKDIASIDGYTLGEDTYSSFTTTYDPLYSSVRQVRLDLGPFVSHLSDDTINLSIYEAGREADAFTFQSIMANTNFFNYSRSRYTLLAAELILLRALTGDSTLTSRMSKSLGELSVSRSGNLSALKERAEEIRKELEEWRKSIMTGGDVPPGTSLRPQVSVKGSLAEDRIVVGRQWEPTSGIGIVSRHSIGNSYRYASGRRDLKTFRNRNQ